MLKSGIFNKQKSITRELNKNKNLNTYRNRESIINKKNMTQECKNQESINL